MYFFFLSQLLNLNFFSISDAVYGFRNEQLSGAPALSSAPVPDLADTPSYHTCESGI